MSNPSTTPFFGRAYSLVVTPAQGPSAKTPITISDDSFDQYALRITFEINQLAFSAFWSAEITVWNADGNITAGPSKGVNLYQSVIQEGSTVSLSAGYQANGFSGVIFEGQVFYTTQDRVNATDRRLTFHCLLSRALTTQNFLNATLPATSTQFTQAQFIASQSKNPIAFNSDQFKTNVEGAIPQRGSVQLPRGKSFFGNPHHYLKSLADQNGLLSWFDGKGWNTDSLQNPAGPLVTTYAPVQTIGQPPSLVGDLTLSLIGQPQQTQFGVNFRVLLDSRVQIVAPLPQVGLQTQYIRQASISYPLPQGQGPPRPLSENGQYIVIGVRLSGDTRGNEWYSEFTAVTLITDVIAMLGQNKQALPMGGNG